MRLAFGRRIASLRKRVLALESLRATVGLPEASDLTARQWAALNAQLGGAAARLLRRLNVAAERDLPRVQRAPAARRLNAALGRLELDLAATYVFFDTYVDVLTQRLSPALGPLLAGCDVIAWEALRRPHPALELVEHPLVYCDRGFGAAIMREGVSLAGGARNPIPLLQVPYARLEEKHNLGSSILHEAGHQALARLGMAEPLAAALRRRIAHAGGSLQLAVFFARWSAELGPDFWGVCSAGLAQAATLRDILALPPDATIRVDGMDPHPPGVLRALFGFECCRQAWGRGPWDEWQREWLELYPLAGAPPQVRAMLEEGARLIPVIADEFLTRRFDQLGGHPLSDLFDMSGLAPGLLARRIDRRAGWPDLSGLSLGAQLAVWRLVRESGGIGEGAFDRAMTRWLLGLGERRETRPFMIHQERSVLYG